MLSTCLPLSGTQCYSFTSYLIYILSYVIILSIMQNDKNRPREPDTNQQQEQIHALSKYIVLFRAKQNSRKALILLQNLDFPAILLQSG